jgi:hypothetical protein
MWGVFALLHAFFWWYFSVLMCSMRWIYQAGFVLTLSILAVFVYDYLDALQFERMLVPLVWLGLCIVLWSALDHIGFVTSETIPPSQALVHAIMSIRLIVGAVYLFVCGSYIEKSNTVYAGPVLMLIGYIMHALQLYVLYGNVKPHYLPKRDNHQARNTIKHLKIGESIVLVANIVSSFIPKIYSSLKYLIECRVHFLNKERSVTIATATLMVTSAWAVMSGSTPSFTGLISHIFDLFGWKQETVLGELSRVLQEPDMVYIRALALVVIGYIFGVDNIRRDHAAYTYEWHVCAPIFPRHRKGFTAARILILVTMLSVVEVIFTFTGHCTLVTARVSTAQKAVNQRWWSFEDLAGSVTSAAGGVGGVINAVVKELDDKNAHDVAYAYFVSVFSPSDQGVPLNVLEPEIAKEEICFTNLGAEVDYMWKSLHTHYSSCEVQFWYAITCICWLDATLRIIFAQKRVKS